LGESVQLFVELPERLHPFSGCHGSDAVGVAGGPSPSLATFPLSRTRARAQGQAASGGGSKPEGITRSCSWQVWVKSSSQLPAVGRVTPTASASGGGSKLRGNGETPASGLSPKSSDQSSMVLRGTPVDSASGGGCVARPAKKDEANLPLVILLASPGAGRGACPCVTAPTAVTPEERSSRGRPLEGGLPPPNSQAATSGASRSPRPMDCHSSGSASGLYRSRCKRRW
jgi:hypothetical protein